MFENKLWREVYMMQNPISVKKEETRQLKLKNINCSSVPQQQTQRTSCFPEVEKKNETKPIPVSQLSPIQQNPLTERKWNGQENRNLEERIRELERKNMERQIEYNKLKFTFEMEMERKNRQSQSERVRQLKLLEHFIGELEMYQKKRLERKKLMISSQKTNNPAGSMRVFGQSQEMERKTDGEIESEQQIDQKSLILAITKELHYIYMRIPQAPQDCDGKLHSIYNSHEQIFLEIINNKIKLNNLVGQ